MLVRNQIFFRRDTAFYRSSIPFFGGIKMIEETVFTKEEIIEIVKNNYNIEVDQIEKLDRGSANLYSLNNKYILKEFQ